jgi:non-ribosomal peptide synthetase component F
MRLSWIRADLVLQPPLLEQTVPQHFQSIVDQHGDRNAVISRAQQTTLTYWDLDQQSNALANGLQELGVKKGERVAVSLGNNIEFAVVCSEMVPIETSLTITRLHMHYPKWGPYWYAFFLLLTG